MTADDFIARLKTRVVDDNLAMYKDLFLNTDEASIRDPYFRRAFQLFSPLSEEQKERFFEVVRQVIVDTVSTMLGILDGTTTLTENEPSEFQLICNNNKLNDYLQDIFLTLFED